MNLLHADHKLSTWLNKTLVGKSTITDDIWKITAVYFVYLIPVFFIVNWFLNVKSRATSIRAAIVGVIGWQIVTPLIAKLWFRDRPFIDTGIGQKELVFHRPTYSFPSDHTLFAFAVASAFYFAGYKEIGISLYILAAIIGISRAIVGVHFPLDIVAGAIIGITMSWFAWHYRATLDPIIVTPFMKIAEFLHLHKA